MTSSSTRRNLHGMERGSLEAVVAEMGVPAYRAAQIFRAVHRHRAADFRRITTLPAALRAALAERYVLERPRIAHRLLSSDGTRKYLLALPDGKEVEAVAIPDRGRWTFCLSSQVGCALGCRFCTTALLGLERHLAPGEIVGQVERLAADVDVDAARVNLVFMGMGEPLHNYEGVTAAIRVLSDPEGPAVPLRRITVSTVGLVPEILRLAAEPAAPRLAISLNAATDELRGELMPAARRWPLSELLEAARRFTDSRRHRLTFEYVLLAGVNDRADDARRLVALLHGQRARVNLIPFNPTPRLSYRRPPGSTVEAFRARLVRAGLRATVRRSRGRDVEAACGQLAYGGRAVSDPGGES